MILETVALLAFLSVNLKVIFLALPILPSLKLMMMMMMMMMIVTCHPSAYE